VDFHGPPPFYRRIAHPLGSDKVVLATCLNFGDHLILMGYTMQ
jgi:hypothetical protein